MLGEDSLKHVESIYVIFLILQERPVTVGFLILIAEEVMQIAVSLAKEVSHPSESGNAAL